MAAGIYSLDFISGNIYIGKSIDITRRAAEHISSLKNGKAAKRLQEEFNTHGEPKWCILFECHPDHIDLMETYYVETLKPALNTAPTIRLKPEELKVIESHRGYMQKSTAEHILEVVEYQIKSRNYEEEIYKLQQKQVKKVIAPPISKEIEEKLINTESILVKLRELYAKNRLEYMETRDMLDKAKKDLSISREEIKTLYTMLANTVR